MKNSLKIWILFCMLALLLCACGKANAPVSSLKSKLDVDITQTREADGMTMVFVPAGEFKMGSADGFDDEKPEHMVYLDSYWIDKTEVTNGQYEKCVMAGFCANPKSDESDTRSSYYGNAEFADYPVINVDWNQAKAYCAWAGGDLPTEAQWEKAARGSDGRTYPWGNANGESKANYSPKNNDTSKVCAYPSGNSPYMACDMAGNVGEWVNDWYDESYYGKSPKANPYGPNSGDSRVLRGGSWNCDDYRIRVAYRDSYSPMDMNGSFGFRCASGKFGTEPKTTPPTFIPIVSQGTATPITRQDAKLGAGATRTREADGMDMVYIPEGEFTMGMDSGKSEERPAHLVTLDAYWIDKTEVTNGQYEKCVLAGACEKPKNSGSETRSSYYGNGDFADYPVISVDWNKAKSYCAWAGGDLPTEAQWEKAARGKHGRMYPWGNAIDGTRLNYCDKNCKNEWKDKNGDDGYADTSPVCAYPMGNSPYGVCDMAGNVWEWTNDWYAADYYEKSPYANPQGAASGSSRVLRGGSWSNYDLYLRVFFRNYNDPAYESNFWGFRCATVAE